MKYFYPKDKDGNSIGFKISESQVYDKDGNDLATKFKNVNSFIEFATEQNEDYLILPNGTKMCWGKTVSAPYQYENTFFAVTFPDEINFENIPALFVSVRDNIGIGDSNSVLITNISNKHANIKVKGSKEQFSCIDWVAIGK